jgi:hypothetical protein
MELTFTLPDGTRAGIVPTGDLRHVSISELGVECLAPAEKVSVVFHVGTRKALDRVRSRFGSMGC